MLSFRICVVVFALSHNYSGLACGSLWKEPRGPIQGVDEQGHALYIQRLGNFSIGEELTLPVWLKFRADDGRHSKFLGAGWSIPLLESQIVQVDEGSFILYQPDGWTRRFYRASPDSNVLLDQGGWKGEINNKTITVWAECGWSFSYQNGYLTTISTPRGKKIKFNRGERKISAVVPSTGQTIQLSRKDDSTVLEAPGIQATFVLDRRPISGSVQNGTPVVDHLVPSLGRIEVADGRKTIFEYGVDPSGDVVLEVREPFGIKSEFAWNSLGIATRFNDWSYFVENLGATYSIRRKRESDGAFQEYKIQPNSNRSVFNDNGRETVLSVHRVGLAAGALRERTVSDGGRLVSSRKYSYNEQGHLLRVLKEGGAVAETWETLYTDDFIISIRRNTEKSLSMIKVYDQSKKLLELFNCDSKTGWKYSYTSDSRTPKIDVYYARNLPFELQELLATATTTYTKNR